MSINICSALRCPHSYQSGCDRFAVSHACPLTRFEGVVANEYWLFANEPSQDQLDAMRLELQTQVLSTEYSKDRLRAEAEWRESPAKMSWE